MFYCGTILQSAFEPDTANKVALGIQVMQVCARPPPLPAPVAHRPPVGEPSKVGEDLVTHDAHTAV